MDLPTKYRCPREAAHRIHHERPLKAVHCGRSFINAHSIGSGLHAAYPRCKLSGVGRRRKFPWRRRRRQHHQLHRLNCSGGLFTALACRADARVGGSLGQSGRPSVVIRSVSRVADPHSRRFFLVRCTGSTIMLSCAAFARLSPGNAKK